MKKLLLLLALTFCFNGRAQVIITPEYDIICNGMNDQIIASGATSYSWQPMPFYSNTTGDTVIVKPFTSTVYTITAITITNTVTNTLAITVNTCTPPHASFGKNADTICVNHCIIFNDVTQNISTKPLFYSWVFLGGQINPVLGGYISGGDTLSYALTSNISFPNVKVCYHTSSLLNPNGKFPITQIVTNGLGQTNIYYDSVIVIPSPSVNFTLVQDALPHTWDAYPNYSAYTHSARWYWGDGTNTIGLYPSHTYSVAGTYSICVTAYSSCSDSAMSCQNDVISRLANNNVLSNMVYVNVLNGTMGINKVASNNEINIYPNPSNGILQIAANNVQVTELKVYDVTGKLVFKNEELKMQNSNTQIDLSSLQSGIYNISIISKEGVVNKRLVISH